MALPFLFILGLPFLSEFYDFLDNIPGYDLTIKPEPESPLYFLNKNNLVTVCEKETFFSDTMEEKFFSDFPTQTYGFYKQPFNIEEFSEFIIDETEFYTEERNAKIQKEYSETNINE
jgi:hypothetical protein